MLRKHRMIGVKWALQHKMVLGDVDERYRGTSDDELAALAAHEPQAFPELLNRYYRIILYKVAHVKACGMDADDLMQEASLGLYSAVQSYTGQEDASFRTFAGVCIDNRLRSAIRNSARDKNKPLSHYMELSDYYKQEDAFSAADAGTDPEATVLIDESVAELRQRLRELLSEREYQVFTQYHLNDCSYEDIAKSLDMDAKAVDNALQRVRRKLKNALLRD